MSPSEWNVMKWQTFPTSLIFVQCPQSNGKRGTATESPTPREHKYYDRYPHHHRHLLVLPLCQMVLARICRRQPASTASKRLRLGLTFPLSRTFIWKSEIALEFLFDRESLFLERKSDLRSSYHNLKCWKKIGQLTFLLIWLCIYFRTFLSKLLSYTYLVSAVFFFGIKHAILTKIVFQKLHMLIET